MKYIYYISEIYPRFSTTFNNKSASRPFHPYCAGDSYSDVTDSNVKKPAPIPVTKKHECYDLPFDKTGYNHSG